MMTSLKFTPPARPVHYLPPAAVEAAAPLVLERRLTWLHAPAGYGKSAALRQFADHAADRGWRTAWLQLDTADDSEAAVLGAVAGAAGLELPRAAGRLAAIGELLQQLAAKAPVLMLVDELDRLRCTQALATFQLLLERSPAGVHWACATRGELPLKLSRWQLAQQVQCLDSSHLALSPSDALPLVQAISGHALDAAAGALLDLRCEGWPAALIIAGLAMRESDDPAALLREFSGCDRDMARYLDENVLDALPETQQAFLAKSAQLNPLCPALCHDVLGLDDAGARLADVRNAGLLLSESDRQGGWLRYHPLLAAHLQRRQVTADPAGARRVQSAAAHWHEQRGALAEALEYALSGGDHAHAAALLEACLPEVAERRGEHDKALAWLHRLPRLQLSHRLPLRVVLVRALLMRQRHAEADAELSQLEGALARTPQPELAPAVAALRCAYWSEIGEHAMAAAASAQWQLAWPATTASLDRAIVLLAAAYAAFVDGDSATAGTGAAEARTLFERLDAPYGAARAIALQALVLQRQGLCDEAVQLLAQARPALADRLGAASPSGAALSALQAAIHYDQNRVQEAEDLLDQAWPALAGASFHEARLAACLTRARLQFLRGWPDAADACLADGAQRALRHSQQRMAQLLQAERLHLLLRAGRTEAALNLSTALGLNAEQSASQQEPMLRLNALRLRLAGQGTPAGAQRLLQDLLHQARQGRLPAIAAQLLCIKACAALHSGQPEEALRLLQDSGHAATGWPRRMRDESPEAEALLQQLDAGHALQPAKGRRGALLAPDHPSERELRILRLVEQGLKNRDMARALFLSDETVKWHLRNIYAKLKVNNRTSAVARARALALL